MVTASAAQIADYMAKYPTHFVDGAKFSMKQFRVRFNFVSPGLKRKDATRTRDSFAFVTTYNALNKVLAYRGLKMHAVDYYSYFVIKAMPEDHPRKAQKRASHIVDRAITRAIGQGYAKAHNMTQWIPLTATEITELEQHIRKTTIGRRY